MSYESSLAAGWESYSDDGYEHEVDVEDPCSECEWQPPKGMTTVAYLGSRDGEATWRCEGCGEENSISINYGYDDIAEDKYYDL